MTAAIKGSSRTDFIFMLVALYFILISFFIILSTLSVHDSEKLRTAVNSITHTFKLNDRIAIVNQKVEPDSYSVFLNELQGWITDLYAVGEVTIVRRGSEVAITISHPQFFKPGTAIFNDGAQKVMKSLGELIARWQTEYLTELEVVADEPTAQAPNPRAPTPNLAAEHAAAVASYLAEHGIAPQALQVSIRTNAEPRLAFTFILRVPPKINEGYVPAS